MARKTYLQLVNAVLDMLREAEVASVSTNAYSSLIGTFVNRAKRQVEDAYDWNALSNTISVTTVASGFSYALTGSGDRFKVLDAYNATVKSQMMNSTMTSMNRLIISPTSTGSPIYYSFNGTDTNGDTKVDIWPIPTGTNVLYFNLFIPQDDLSASSDTLYVPSEPVILNAYARALVERGEDGGLSSSEAYSLYKNSLSDSIAIEGSRYLEEMQWVAV
jgi:hypothetical protein